MKPVRAVSIGNNTGLLIRNLKNSKEVTIMGMRNDECGFPNVVS